MPNVVLSAVGNILKVSFIDDAGLKEASIELQPEIFQDDKIIDTKKFAEAAGGLLLSIDDKYKKRTVLNFLVSPEDVILKFVTVNKRDGEADTQILSELAKVLEGVKLEELYYSHSKIAPFVYQFIGIRKEILEKYVEIANFMQLPLNSAIPWILLLPRYVNVNEPSIFICEFDGHDVVAASELNGVFYVDVADRKSREKTTKELQKMIEEASVYKKTTPITKVFLLGNETLNLGSDFEVTKLIVPNGNLENAKGYELHLLYHYMLDLTRDTVESQTNLLNLLPVPVVYKKSPVGVYVASSLGVLLLVGGIVGGLMFLKTRNVPQGNQVAQNTKPATAVLSETTANVGQTAPSQNPITEEKKPELKREDLKIRIENGANITGIAAKTRDLLQKLGYTVTGVGNADVVGRQNTLLKFKKDKTDYKEMVLKDMEKNYLDIVVQDDLDVKSAHDLLIVIGTNVKGL